MHSRLAAQADVATQFRDLGIHLPVRPGDGILRALVDADGAVFAVLIPGPNATIDRHRAEALAAAINAAGGTVPALQSIAAE